jgi:hypothetical protein
MNAARGLGCESHPVHVMSLQNSQTDIRLPDHTRDLAMEAALLDVVLCLVHKHFFEGQSFFGVGSDSLHEHLETMYYKLIEGGE